MKHLFAAAWLGVFLPSTLLAASLSLDKTVPGEAETWMIDFSRSEMPALAAGPAGVKTLKIGARRAGEKTLPVPKGASLAVVSDPQDKVVGVLHTRGYSEDREGWDTADFEIRGRKGEVLLRIANMKEMISPRPSPSGDYAVGWYAINTPESRPLIFRSKGDGYEAKPVNDWPAGMDAYDARFSPDGRVFLVATHQKSGLLFDNQGRKLAQLPDFGAVAFQSEKAFVSSESELLVVDTKTGAIDRRLKLPLSRVVIPSDDGKRIALLTMSNEVLLVTSEGEEKWRWKGESLNSFQQLGPEAMLRLTGLSATPALDRLVVSGFTKAYVPFQWGDRVGKKVKQVSTHLALLSAEGKILAEATPPNEDLLFATNAATKLQISDDGKKVAIPTKKGLSIYRIDE